MRKPFPQKAFSLTLLCALFVFGLVRAALSQAEDKALVSLYRARVFFNLGEYEKALAEYDEAKNDDSYYRTCLLNQAIIYKDTLRYDQAIMIYKELLRIAENKIIYKNLGEAYYLDGQADNAISCFVKALEMGAKDPMIYFWIAKAYEDKKDTENAVWAYKQALKRDSDFALAHFDLAMAYTRKKLWQEAQSEFEKAKELDPSLPEIDACLGLMNYKQDYFDQALSFYKKAKAVDPDNAEIQKQIALIHKRAGKGLQQELEKRQKDRISQSQAKMLKANQIEEAPMVKVHIGDVKKMRFKSAVDFMVMSINRQSVEFKGQKDRLYTLICRDAQICLMDNDEPAAFFSEDIVINNQDTRSTILVFDVEAGSGNYWASRTDRIYRGQIIVSLRAEQSLRLINYLNMEEYLYGVLPSEMPNDWPEEALKAQAVAARSEAFWKMGRHKNDGFDFCSEVHCQAYNGAKVETSRTNKAVDLTCGQAATYKGKPIDAVYSNSCGGHTQGNIFGDRTVIDYWQPKQDSKENLGFYFPISPLELEDWLWPVSIKAFCNNKKFSRRSNFRWLRSYSQQQLQELISKKYDIGRLLRIIIMERNPSSHIHKVKIIGTKGEFIVEKELNIRNLFGNLRSGMFNISVKLDKTAKPQEYIFYGGGWGHGVGMCQVGAASMADQGFDYQDILHFYFQDIQIEKMY